MKTKYNKLVRNNIVPLIEKDGKRPIYRTIQNTEDFRVLLIKKLAEETVELTSAMNKGHKANICEEIADVLEVINTIAATYKISSNQIEYVRLGKLYEKGGFSMRTYLEEVEE